MQAFLAAMAAAGVTNVPLNELCYGLGSVNYYATDTIDGRPDGYNTALWPFTEWEGQTWGRGDGSTDGNGNSTVNLFFNGTGQIHDLANVCPKLSAARDYAAAANPAYGAYFVASPAVIPSGHIGHLTVSLTGVGTSWSGTPFSVSGVSGTTLISQSVSSTTSASLVLTTGSGTGTLTVSDGSENSTIAVNAPTLGVSPTSVSPSSGTTITATGGNTVWAQETASTLFSVSGLSGASISSITVSNNYSATFTLTTGATTGSATIKDSSTGQTAAISVISSGMFTASPASIPAMLRGDITVTLSGSGTSWSGTPFSISGVSGAALISQTVISTTSATIILTTGTGTGSLSIYDGAHTGTVTIAVGAISLNPSVVRTSTATVLAVTGLNTVWTQESPSMLFSVSGLSGASLANIAVANDCLATFTLTTGATAGAAMITDASTGQVAAVSSSSTAASSQWYPSLTRH